MAIAVFDYAAWSVRYPALASVTPGPTASAIFDDVGLTLIDNSNASPICDPAQRLAIMNLAVAHIATLDERSGTGGDAAASSPGRVGSASEGSVSVVLAYDASNAAQWWAQTTYGALAWEAMKRFRMGFYRPGPRPYTGVPLAGRTLPWYR